MAKIKICGLKRLEDIKYVNEWMPDFIGFVFAGEKRKINYEIAKMLKEGLNPKIKTVGVFVNEHIESIARLVEENILDMVQLHGDEDNEYITLLKGKINVPIIKAVRVKNKESIEDAQKLNVDYLLFDTYEKGVYGGTGKTIDKNLLSQDYDHFFLAGGLNESNLEEMIRLYHPYAVDLSSGVETDGIKDQEKIKKVIEIVRSIED